MRVFLFILIIPNFAIGTIYRRIICNKEMQSKFGITPACTKNLVEIFRPALCRRWRHPAIWRWRAKNAIAFFGIMFFLAVSISYAAPSYGTDLPQKHKLSVGLESHTLFKRYLEDNLGTMRSQQQFYAMSFGVFDWFSIDLKAGTGNIKQRPQTGDKVNYSASFAGGYGLRLRFFDKKNMKAALGFQHISVHPKSKHLGSVKNRAILDDWQWSLLGSYSFKRITPYLGTRWSRIDYIHWVADQRKRRMSDFSKSVGLIYGVDFFLTKNICLNLEGSSFDSDALACRLSYDF